MDLALQMDKVCVPNVRVLAPFMSVFDPGLVCRQGWDFSQNLLMGNEQRLPDSFGPLWEEGAGWVRGGGICDRKTRMVQTA